ncbi:MAG: 5-formyltetrahydrofolate cyclo-ligase [Euryarchaeota archaeon]|nr:5-formyltetrahydrofolate cyclo-ligase [Euryarchaeota archaeon]
MKKSLREQFLIKRKELSKSEVKIKSQQIQHRLFSSPWYRTAHTILFYVSYDNEVNTHDMIKESLLSGKTVLVPKTDTRKKTICLSKLLRWDDLSPGAYSILEPREDCIREVPVSTVELFIVPGVVFDLCGNRIGHGMGYYDRLLKTTFQAHSIGLAFEYQIMISIPAEEHDEKVEMIITEDRSIHCH